MSTMLKQTAITLFTGRPLGYRKNCFYIRKLKQSATQITYICLTCLCCYFTNRYELRELGQRRQESVTIMDLFLVTLWIAPRYATIILFKTTQKDELSLMHYRFI